MFEFLSRVGDQLRDFYNTLNTGKRTALVMLAVALITGVGSLLFWAGGSDYQTLASNLVSEDATSIMRLLREKKVPFKVDDDGKTIKIPPDAIHEFRLELATMGMAQTNIIGYEVFDKQSFGTTSFVQKINQKRSLEGELTRTINNLKGVQRSRVHLALPTTSTFKEDQKKTTASVVMDLEKGHQLSDKQLNGIQHLVASAIEGMDATAVVVMDANGKILSKNNADPLAAQSATIIELTQKLEGEYEGKIQDILTKVIGEGKIVAKVSLEMDFTQNSESQTQYDQEGSAIKSQQKENHLVDGSRPVPMGAPGAVSNTPGPQPASTNPEVRTNNNRVFEVNNYQVPEKITKSIKAPYLVKRMSVAVLVDGNYKKDPSKGETATAVFEKWPDEKLNEFKTIIASAVAIDLKRGDIIEVKNMEFRHEDLTNAEEQIAGYEKKKMIQNVIQYGVIGLIVGLFFFFVVRPFMKWLTENTVESMESFLPKTIEELEKVQTTDKEIVTLEEAIPVIVDKVDPEKVEGEMIKEKVVTLIENNPQKAAMILHEWLIKPAKIAKEEATAAGGKKA